MYQIIRQITSNNINENFSISFLKILDLSCQEEDKKILYRIRILDLKNNTIETAEFYTEDAAKEVYFNFLNWSIKGLHTFSQRVLVLKDFEKQYKK